MNTKIKLSPDQRRALDAYRFAEKQEDRYMGSVFVNAHGARLAQERTRAAYDDCKRLGMTWEHGL